MLKLVLFAVIIACGVCVGLEKKKNMGIRVKSLEMFHRIFYKIKSEIMYSQKPLHIIISNIALQNQDNDFITKCRLGLIYNSFSQAWSDALDSSGKELCLTLSDILFLKQASERMGKSSLYEEESNLIQIIGELEALISEAKEKHKTDGRVWMTVSSSLGIIIALITL